MYLYTPTTPAPPPHARRHHRLNIHINTPAPPARRVITEVAEAGRLLRAGGLVAFPTETVYGLGASAYDEAAVRRIFEVGVKLCVRVCV